MTANPLIADPVSANQVPAGQLDSHTWRNRGGLDVLDWPVFDERLVDAFVTTRHGGVSGGRYASLNLGLHVGDDEADVRENRSRVARALGADLGDFVFGEQAHGPRVAVVTAEHRGRGAHTAADAIERTDALVTTVPGVVLVVLVADCVPIVLHDPVAGVLAVVHAGWGGTVRGVTPAAVAAMTRLGSDPRDVVAGIGPAIHPDRYQVGADVVAAAAGACDPTALDEVVRPDGSGKWTFDLWRANALQLTAAGVPAGAIQVAGLGTGPDTPFFSHRGERPCGRFAAVARLRPSGASR